MDQSSRDRAKVAILLLILTAAEIFATYAIHVTNRADIVFDSFRVFEGWAEWRIYQSRILLPYLIGGISDLTGVDFAVVRELVQNGIFILTNAFLFWLIDRRFRNSWLALRTVFIHVLLFVYFQTKMFYYDWDTVDQLIFPLFAFAILARLDLRWFAGLFLLELLNRESAAFIGVLLIVCAIVPATGSAPKLRLGYGFLGLGMVAISGVTARTLRESLHLDAARELFEGQLIMGQMWKLPSNMVQILPPYISIKQFYPWIVIGLFAFYAARSWRTGYIPARQLVIVGVCIGVSLFCFADLTETRVFIPITSFIALLTVPVSGWNSAQKNPAPAQRREQGWQTCDQSI